jgi:hypothetical protein
MCYMSVRISVSCTAVHACGHLLENVLSSWVNKCKLRLKFVQDDKVVVHLPILNKYREEETNQNIGLSRDGLQMSKHA